jgi:hypothetical protein
MTTEPREASWSVPALPPTRRDGGWRFGWETEFNAKTPRRKGAGKTGKYFAVLFPDIIAFGKDFSGKVVAQASRLCVPAKLSPITETHGRDARATLLATFLWLRLCRAMPLRLCVKICHAGRWQTVCCTGPDY